VCSPVLELVDCMKVCILHARKINEMSLKYNVKYYVRYVVRLLTDKEELKYNVKYYVRYVVRLLTLRLLMSYIYGAPSKARNASVVYIWTYVWQR